jgi:hypothetical protein
VDESHRSNTRVLQVMTNAPILSGHEPADSTFQLVLGPQVCFGGLILIEVKLIPTFACP